MNAGRDDQGAESAPGMRDRQDEPRKGSAPDVSTVSKWEAFFQGTDYVQIIREVADNYPDVRSVFVVYSDLDKFDADLASYLLDHPDLAMLAGKEAIRNLMHS